MEFQDDIRLIQMMQDLSTKQHQTQASENFNKIIDQLLEAFACTFDFLRTWAAWKQKELENAKLLFGDQFIIKMFAEWLKTPINAETIGSLTKKHDERLFTEQLVASGHMFSNFPMDLVLFWTTSMTADSQKAFWYFVDQLCAAVDEYENPPSLSDEKRKQLERQSSEIDKCMENGCNATQIYQTIVSLK